MRPWAGGTASSNGQGRTTSGWTGHFGFASAARPREPETVLLLRLLAEESAELAADRNAARQIAGNNLPPGRDVIRQAAWTVVCRALMSVDEFMTRE